MAQVVESFLTRKRFEVVDDVISVRGDFAEPLVWGVRRGPGVHFVKRRAAVIVVVKDCVAVCVV